MIAYPRYGLLLADRMVIIQFMSRYWVALLLLLCLAIPVVGSASALDGRPPLQQDAQREAGVATVHLDVVGNQPMMVTSAHQQDVDCDDDGCDDGHCKHRCACGCGMNTCAPSCLAFFAQPSAFTWARASVAIAPLVAQQPAATRSTSPLRPPIV